MAPKIMAQLERMEDNDLAVWYKILSLAIKSYKNKAGMSAEKRQKEEAKTQKQHTAVLIEEEEAETHKQHTAALIEEIVSSLVFLRTAH